MSIKYKKYPKDPKTNKESNSIQKTNEDGTILSIPLVVGNTDYQDYLEWVAEGNTADPAD